MKSLLVSASLFVLLLAIVGCSNKELYQFGKQQQESECIEEAISESQINDCKSENRPTYKEYKKEREEIIN